MGKTIRNKYFVTILFITIFVIILLLCSGCNKEVFEFNMNLDRAICNYNGDRFELKIDKWSDYEGEQIQVKSDGVVYLLSANNCYFIDD